MTNAKQGRFEDAEDLGNRTLEHQAKFVREQ